MKKTVFTFFALILLISSSSLAQFKIGPRFGLNFSSISSDPEVPSGYTDSGIMGLMFGVAIEMGIAGPVYIAIEPSYIQKGQDIDGPIPVGNPPQLIQGTLTRKASYLQFPILGKVKFPLGVVSPYAFVGPNIGIKLSATQSFVGGGQDIEEDYEDISSLDFGLDLGGGVAFNIVPMMSLVFDIRYSLGLTNILDVQAQQGQVEPSANTRGLQMMIGAMFGL